MGCFVWYALKGVRHKVVFREMIMMMMMMMMMKMKMKMKGVVCSSHISIRCFTTPAYYLQKWVQPTIPVHFSVSQQWNDIQFLHSFWQRGVGVAAALPLKKWHPRELESIHPSIHLLLHREALLTEALFGGMFCLGESPELFEKKHLVVLGDALPKLNSKFTWKAYPNPRIEKEQVESNRHGFQGRTC